MDTDKDISTTSARRSRWEDQNSTYFSTPSREGDEGKNLFEQATLARSSSSKSQSFLTPRESPSSQDFAQDSVRSTTLQSPFHADVSPILLMKSSFSSDNRVSTETSTGSLDLSSSPKLSNLVAFNNVDVHPGLFHTDPEIFHGAMVESLQYYFESETGMPKPTTTLELLRLPLRPTADAKSHCKVQLVRCILARRIYLAGELKDTEYYPLNNLVNFSKELIERFHEDMGGIIKQCKPCKQLLDLAKGVPYRGLTNSGNTCYLASILQCLFANQGLASALETYDHTFCLMTKSFVKLRKKVLCNLQIGPVSLQECKEVLAARHKQFKGNEQQDATACLEALLSYINKESFEKLSWSINNKAVACRKLTNCTGDFNSAPIAREFKCSVAPEDTCSSKICNWSSTRASHSFWALPVSVVKPLGKTQKVSVQECVDHFLKSYELEGFDCPQCGHNCVTRREKILNFPPTLILHPTQEHGDHQAFTGMPRETEISFAVKAGTIHYALDAVCFHSGTNKGGHYTATVYRKRQSDSSYEFVTFNDKECYTTEGWQSTPLRPVLLFYRRKHLQLSEIPSQARLFQYKKIWFPALKSHLLRRKTNMERCGQQQQCAPQPFFNKETIGMVVEFATAANSQQTWEDLDNQIVRRVFSSVFASSTSFSCQQPPSCSKLFDVTDLVLDQLDESELDDDKLYALLLLLGSLIFGSLIYIHSPDLTELEQEQQPSSHKDLDRVSSTVNTEQGCLEPDSNSALQDQAKLPSGAGTKNGWNGRGSHSFAIGASINKEGAAAGLGDRQKLLRGSARSKSTTMTPNPDEATGTQNTTAPATRNPEKGQATRTKLGTENSYGRRFANLEPWTNEKWNEIIESIPPKLREEAGPKYDSSSIVVTNKHPSDKNTGATPSMKASCRSDGKGNQLLSESFPQKKYKESDTCTTDGREIDSLHQELLRLAGLCLAEDKNLLSIVSFDLQDSDENASGGTGDEILSSRKGMPDSCDGNLRFKHLSLGTPEFSSMTKENWPSSERKAETSDSKMDRRKAGKGRYGNTSSPFDVPFEESWTSEIFAAPAKIAGYFGPDCVGHSSKFRTPTQSGRISPTLYDCPSAEASPIVPTILMAALFKALRKLVSTKNPREDNSHTQARKRQKIRHDPEQKEVGNDLAAAASNSGSNPHLVGDEFSTSSEEPIGTVPPAETILAATLPPARLPLSEAPIGGETLMETRSVSAKSMNGNPAEVLNGRPPLAETLFGMKTLKETHLKNPKLSNGTADIFPHVPAKGIRGCQSSLMMESLIDACNYRVEANSFVRRTQYDDAAQSYSSGLRALGQVQQALFNPSYWQWKETTSAMLNISIQSLVSAHATSRCQKGDNDNFKPFCFCSSCRSNKEQVKHFLSLVLNGNSIHDQIPRIPSVKTSDKATGEARLGRTMASPTSNFMSSLEREADKCTVDGTPGAKRQNKFLESARAQPFEIKDQKAPDYVLDTALSTTYLTGDASAPKENSSIRFPASTADRNVTPVESNAISEEILNAVRSKVTSDEAIKVGEAALQTAHSQGHYADQSGGSSGKSLELKEAILETSSSTNNSLVGVKDVSEESRLAGSCGGSLAKAKEVAKAEGRSVDAEDVSEASGEESPLKSDNALAQEPEPAELSTSINFCVAEYLRCKRFSKEEVAGFLAGFELFLHDPMFPFAYKTSNGAVGDAFVDHNPGKVPGSENGGRTADKTSVDPTDNDQLGTASAFASGDPSKASKCERPSNTTDSSISSSSGSDSDKKECRKSRTKDVPIAELMSTPLSTHDSAASHPITAASTSGNKNKARPVCRFIYATPWIIKKDGAPVATTPNLEMKKKETLVVSAPSLNASTKEGATSCVDATKTTCLEMDDAGFKTLAKNLAAPKVAGCVDEKSTSGSPIGGRLDDESLDSLNNSTESPPKSLSTSVFGGQQDNAKDLDESAMSSSTVDKEDENRECLTPPRDATTKTSASPREKDLNSIAKPAAKASSVADESSRFLGVTQNGSIITVSSDVIFENGQDMFATDDNMNSNNTWEAEMENYSYEAQIASMCFKDDKIVVPEYTARRIKDVRARMIEAKKALEHAPPEVVAYQSDGYQQYLLDAETPFAAQYLGEDKWNVSFSSHLRILKRKQNGFAWNNTEIVEDSYMKWRMTSWGYELLNEFKESKKPFKLSCKYVRSYVNSLTFTHMRPTPCNEFHSIQFGTIGGDVITMSEAEAVAFCNIAQADDEIVSNRELFPSEIFAYMNYCRSVNSPRMHKLRAGCTGTLPGGVFDSVEDFAL